MVFVYLQRPPKEHFVFLNTFDSPTDSIPNWVSVIAGYKPKAIDIELILGDTLPHFESINNVPVIYGIGLEEMVPLTDQKKHTLWHYYRIQKRLLD